MSATVVSEEVLVTFPCTSAKALSINSDSCGDSCIDASEEEDEAPLDQRHLNLVHEELEKLNIATDVINKLELQLDEARARFSEIQSSWSEKLRELSKKYGSAIGKARPFYEAKYQERKLRDELQRAALRFERAHSMQQVAKQQVNLTQESLNRQSTVHPECLEVLNHHISRVNEAEKERVEAEEAHKVVSTKLLSLAREISKMEKDQKSAIKKSYQYFEKRKEFTLVLEQQKDLIQRLEAEVRQKKCDYTTSMGNLERISDSIHEQRSLNGQSRARIAKEAPANPPPYMPTAPPPYEQLTGSGASRGTDAFSNREALKFIIGNDPEDEIIEPVLTMLEGDMHWNKERPKNLGSGVILLAQQLMGGEPEPQHENYILSSRSSQSDVRYQTCLPEGIPANTPETPSSDTSSLASARASLNLTDEENLAGMLRSHSQLIQEIDGCANRVEMLLRRSVSDTERESGTESSNGAF